jgi:hypothetical protein
VAMTRYQREKQNSQLKKKKEEEVFTLPKLNSVKYYTAICKPRKNLKGSK